MTMTATAPSSGHGVAAAGNAAATTRPGPQELLRQMKGGQLYRRAAEDGMGLSAWLETQDPSDQHRDGLDAFSRLMRVANIRSRSDAFRGYYADRFEAFDRNEETRALMPEWLIRQYRRAAGQQVNTRAYTSDDQALNSLMRPYADAMTPRFSPQIAPAVPISEVTATNTGITGDAYRSFYLTDVAAQSRLVRVSEGAELPRAKLVGAEHTIRLYKYGRILEVTYETVRRMPLDMVQLHVSRIAIQSQVDKLATIIDVILNGDGNSGTAATSYNLTALDSAAVAGTLTLKGWLAFKFKFPNPYSLTTALAQEAMALQLALLNTGSANIPLVNIQAASGFGGITPINPELADNVALGITADAPASKIVGLDRRFGIERVFEVGADIQEIIRWAERQTTGLSLSEVEGYATFDGSALRILNVAA